VNFSGVQLQLMIGPTVPVPVPREVAQALENVEVKHSDQEPSGFQLTFRVTHSGPLGLLTEVLLSSPLFEVFNRVIISVVFRGQSQVLIDGFITNQQHQPGEQPGTSRLTLTGEDISVMMDQEERDHEHPGQDTHIIALQLIGRYAKYGLMPNVIAGLIDPPSPSDRTPVWQGTDLEYLQALAKSRAFRFYITPGPAPLTSVAYWGPPIRVGVPQKALSVNMGSHSNVDSIDFEHNALAPTLVEGTTQDADSNQPSLIRTFGSLRPPLASLPDWQLKRTYLRRAKHRRPARNKSETNDKAQAETENSMDDVLTANGELDVMRYGALLQPRALVGVRGAGLLYDGFYQVRQVTHVISRGSYKQRFSLGREGLGTTTPVVRP
jgi:hypothetical protein